MQINVRLITIGVLVVMSSLAAAGIMYAFTDGMSVAAFFGWAVMFAAPQFALMPAHSRGSCSLMDRLVARK